MSSNSGAAVLFFFTCFLY